MAKVSKTVKEELQKQLKKKETAKQQLEALENVSKALEKAFIMDNNLELDNLDDGFDLNNIDELLERFYSTPEMLDIEEQEQIIRDDIKLAEEIIIAIVINFLSAKEAEYIRKNIWQLKYREIVLNIGAKIAA